MAYLCSVGALAILAIPGGSRATGPNTLGNGQFVKAPGKRHRYRGHAARGVPGSSQANAENRSINILSSGSSIAFRACSSGSQRVFLSLFSRHL